MRNSKILLIIFVLFFSFVEKGMSTFSEWGNAGILLTTPTYAQHLLNVKNDYTGTDDQKVQAALTVARTYSQAGETSIIFFPAGTYELHNTIILQNPDSNIIFQGAGSNSTTLKFTLNNPDAQCFSIIGQETVSHITTLTNTVNFLSYSFSANNLSGLNIGDWFRLSEFNHPVSPGDD